ncbi:MAG: hypothetical protein QW797_00200 [Thermoproteota archaeon]
MTLRNVGGRLVNWYYEISPPIALKNAGSEGSKTIDRCIVDLLIALI